MLGLLVLLVDSREEFPSRCLSSEDCTVAELRSASHSRVFGRFVGPWLFAML